MKELTKLEETVLVVIWRLGDEYYGAFGDVLSGDTKLFHSADGRQWETIPNPKKFSVRWIASNDPVVEPALVGTGVDPVSLLHVRANALEELLGVSLAGKGLAPIPTYRIGVARLPPGVASALLQAFASLRKGCGKDYSRPTSARLRATGSR